MIKKAIIRVRKVMITSLKRIMYLPRIYICLIWNNKFNQAAVMVNALMFQFTQDLSFKDWGEESQDIVEYSSEATYVARIKVMVSRRRAIG